MLWGTHRETRERLHLFDLRLSTNGMVLLRDGRAIDFNDIIWDTEGEHEEAQPEP